MNFQRCLCTLVYTYRGIHIRLFMTMRDVWLSYTTRSTYARGQYCRDAGSLLVNHYSLVSHFVLFAKRLSSLLDTITPVSRCFHPPNGAIGVSKRLRWTMVHLHACESSRNSCIATSNEVRMSFQHFIASVASGEAYDFFIVARGACLCYDDARLARALQRVASGKESGLRLIVVIEHCALAMPQATPYGEINRRFPLPGTLLQRSESHLGRTLSRYRKRKRLSPSSA